MNVKLKIVLICFVTILLVLFFCEFFIYYVIILKCWWPSLSGHSLTVRAMVLADTHLLGRVKGHWFDKLRREWQMWRSFQTSVQLLSPNIVIVLGDLFDEGQWASDQDFEVYVNRFYDLFGVDSNIKLMVVVGNHDIGFHYWTDSYLRRRFDLAFNTSDVHLFRTSNGVHFVSINSIALEGDKCRLCVDAVNKIREIGKNLRTNNVSPIVLMHFPLYRESEQICTESDSASDEEKTIKFRERLDCLSKESTTLVLNELNPRLVLTGHSHHSCVVTHRLGSKQIPEWTVASFSWRNKKNPSFLLTTISSDNYSINKCFLPNETHIYCIYFFSFIFLILFNISIIFVKYLAKPKFE